MNRNHARGFALIVPAILALGLVAGCGGDAAEDKADATPAGTATVESAVEEVAPVEVAAPLTEAEAALVAKAAAIAAAVEKAPAMAGTILEENGVTLDEYEAMIYEIAGSAKLTEAFDKAKAGF